MIRVTFELLPGGIESRARTIGVMEIANVRTHENGTADYTMVMKKTPPFKGALRHAWRTGRLSHAGGIINSATSGEDEDAIIALVEGHHRTRRGVYDLLYRAMRAAGLDKRNTEDRQP